MSSAKRLAREILDTRRLALGHATSPQLTSSAIDGGGIAFRDADGNPIAGIGLDDDGGFIIDYTGGPKPPKPSPPTVTADAGIFRIEWDGSFVNEGDEGILATSDTDRVEIHASMDENFVPDRVESFGGAFATLDGGSFTLGPLPEAGTYYFRLVARSKSAQFSEPSDRVEQELAITSIDLEITDAWLTGEAAQNTADGKNSIWRGPDEPEVDPDRPFKDGDIWFEMTEDGKSTPNIWDETAGAWVANDDYRQSEIERVQDELRQELDDIVIDGSGTKNFYTPDMPTEGMREGDLWFDSSDKNKPYIYQDGEWITVQSSFDSPGAGETLASSLDEGFFGKVVTSTPDLALIPGADSRFGYSGTSTGTVSVTFPVLGAADPSDLSMIFDGTEASKAGLGLLANMALYVNSPGGAPTVESLFLLDLPTMGEITPLAVEIPVTGGSGGYSGATHYVTKVDDDTAAALDMYMRFGLASRVAFGVRVTFPAVAGAWVEAMNLKVSQTLGGDGIVDGAITTDKIAVGAITAESGIIGSINAGTITVGEMNGARIKAGTITADKVLIGGDTNLVVNPSFAQGLAGWAVSSGVTTNTQGAFVPLNGTVTSTPFKVDGSPVRVRVAASSANITVKAVGVLADDSTEELTVTLAADGTDASTGHSIRAGSFTPPSTWTHASVLVQKSGASGSAVVSFASAVTQVGSTLIQDGAITTGKIAAGAITAESGIIGSIDANVITVGKIMGNQLDADAINGKTITGATIRTASSGSRVELTHNGLKQYNSLGATIVDMTAGSFTLQGGSITGSTIKTAESGARVEIDANGLRSYAPDGEATAVIDSATGTVGIQGTLAVPSADLMMELRGFGTAGHPGLLFTGPESVFGRSTSSATGPIGNAGRILSSAYGSGLEILGPRNSDYDAGAWIRLSPNEDGRMSGMYVPTSRGDVGIFATTSFYGEVLLGTSSGKGGGPDRIGDLSLGRDSSGSRVTSAAIYARKYGSGYPLMRITSVGNIGTDSSARRFKVDEQAMATEEYADNLLSVPYKSWVSREDQRLHEEYLAFREESPIGPVPQALGDAPQEAPIRDIGLVAEDLEDAGVGEFVQYDSFGQTQGVAYDRIAAALIPIIRDLRDRVEELESRLEALEVA